MGVPIGAGPVEPSYLSGVLAGALRRGVCMGSVRVSWSVGVMGRRGASSCVSVGGSAASPRGRSSRGESREAWSIIRRRLMVGASGSVALS